MASNMEMAKYIMSILRAQVVILWSWGFNSPVAIEKGLRFKVQGFKFRGVVEIKYNETPDLFDVSYIKAGKVIKLMEGIFFDELVNVIDEYVEKTADYNQRVRKAYSIGI